MWPLPAVVAGLVALVTACGPATEDEGDGEAGEEREPEMSGLALLHRGYDGGDPDEDQALVFHDPETGEETAVVALPEGAVDPMATTVPAHAMFSSDWGHFAHATPESGTVELATLTDDGSRYEATATLDPPEGQEWGDPRVAGGQLWFTAEEAGAGRSDPRILSVPLEGTEASPTQEATLPRGENGRPTDWTVDPDGELYLREQQRTARIPGDDGELVVRESGDNVMNATLITGGQQWQDLGPSPVWGGGTVVVGPVGANGGTDEGRDGARLVAVDENGQGFESTRVLDGGDGPVLQYAPAPDRDGLLLQSGGAWHRVAIDDAGAGEAEELFPVPLDASMAGYPLVVRWSEPRE
ncbi:hypothetical protein EFW17_12470 [Halostreptopolyspora alba]|uniref:Exo-alpha-sialidase n=1 Tax=Halostreptopolyspora alba TaxID=2487137 RepID=A0A3N0E943_9ACTN|nr:hypothetical protein EFW17_12470 [Nocardiopsaceae bacterium YIM 96095]